MIPSSIVFMFGLLVGAVGYTYLSPIVSQFRESRSVQTAVNSVHELADLLSLAGAECSFLREPEAARSLGVEQTVVCAEGDYEHHLAIHTSRQELFRGLELMSGGAACLSTPSMGQGDPMIVHSERWSVITTSRQAAREIVRITGAATTTLTCSAGRPMTQSTPNPSGVG
jgi:hypothetical protein